MFFYIKCVLFVLVLSISGEISAQENRDSVRIYFHQGKVNIEIHVYLTMGTRWSGLLKSVPH